jgi:hypothetical protein
MKRREFLAGAGAMTVLVAGGGVWRAADRGVWSIGDGPAYEPWATWRSDRAQGPLALVKAGILASNPHNTQPWLFRVNGSQVDLLADTSRHLGAFDAYRREMFLGLGCAIENMMLAATAAGYEPRLTLTEGTLDPPPGDTDPVHAARIDLEPASPASSPLHDAIPRRHTNRGPYQRARPVPHELRSGLRRVGAEGDEDIGVVLITGAAERASLGELIIASTEAIIADEEMVHDSERWYRHSRSEVEAHRDGPTLDATGLPRARIAIAKLLPRPSARDNHAYWLANTREIQVPTAPAFGMIAVRELYDRAQTLRAGRAWQRMHLWATSQGLAMQPLNQPVELVDRKRALGLPAPTARALTSFTGDRSREPTFVFRVGYPMRDAPPSPRRAASEVMIGG